MSIYIYNKLFIIYVLFAIFLTPKHAKRPPSGGSPEPWLLPRMSAVAEGGEASSGGGQGR